VYISFVSSDAVNGNILKNPYNLDHFSLNYIHLSSDVHTNIRPIRLNVEKSKFLEAYLSLYGSSGIKFNDTSNAIKREQYLNGNFIVGFDLTDDLEASSNLSYVFKTGSLQVDLAWDKPLTSSICMILYTEYSNEIQITKNREIILDYSS
jgi:hypothetical protein